MSAADKEEFLAEFGEYYGYPNAPKTIDQIRATEFKRLENGVVYLDHAGSTLYSELQMEAIFKDLSTTVYGNPHGQSDSSFFTDEIMCRAREQVLKYFNAPPEEYKCIFTSGATAALKLVGETFPWSCDSNFMYTMENHNSVLGIREYALDRGASAIAVDVEEAVHTGEQAINLGDSLKISHHQVQRRNDSRVMEGESTGNAFNLFAFPSECNFTGLRFSLDLVSKIKENSTSILEGTAYLNEGHWMVLIDAAKGCVTQPPDLSKYSADFVVMSFYKIFGYPTGLGALIIRNDAAKLLKKTYFSGGTVAASIADVDFVKRREGVEEHFEDGTTSFLSIASIQHGFKIINSLTVSAIYRHTTSLAMYLKKTLLGLRHANGAAVCMLYGSNSLKFSSHDSGPIVSFNLKRPDGSWFGYLEVEKLASLSGIQLRTGCFCNPGACAKYLGLSHLDLLSNIEAGHVCWDDNDILHGKPTGAVRVSFGYMSTFEDAKKFVSFITSFFVSLMTESENQDVIKSRSIRLSNEGLGRRVPASRYYLKSIIIYPIKSCTGFTVESWPLGPTGLKHDHEWLLRSHTGEILTQKKVPEMCLISTFIDLNKGVLFVESPYCKVNLQIKIASDSHDAGKEEIDLNSRSYEVHGYRNEVNVWFSNAIGRPCTLLQSSSSKYCLNNKKSVGLCREVGCRLNFTNEAQFLLISEESVSDLNKRLISNAQQGISEPVQVNPMRFRPNLLIAGGEPYSEDGWTNIKIGNKYFTSLGGCSRCHMVNSVYQAGKMLKSKEPLATLASYRRVKGKILFGILLKYNFCTKVDLETDSWLQVGQEIHPN